MSHLSHPAQNSKGFGMVDEEIGEGGRDGSTLVVRIEDVATKLSGSDILNWRLLHDAFRIVSDEWHRHQVDATLRIVRLHRVVATDICLTPKAFRDRKTGGGMGAHDAADAIPISSEAVHQPDGESALSILSVDDELGDPAHRLAVDIPPTCEPIARQLIIDDDFCVERVCILWKTLGPQTSVAKSHTTSYSSGQQRPTNSVLCDLPSRGVGDEVVGCTPHIP